MLGSMGKPSSTYRTQYPGYTWPPAPGHRRFPAWPTVRRASGQTVRPSGAPLAGSPQWQGARRRGGRASDASASGHRNWSAAHRPARASERSTSAPCTAAMNWTKCSAGQTQ